MTLGRYHEALAAFELALVAYRERGERREVRIARWMIAHNLWLQKRYDEALAIQLDLERELAAEGESDPEVSEEIAELRKALGADRR
jgi:hypothetical protein